MLAYLFDEIIHSEDYLTQTYPDIPLLSVIPDMTAARQRSGGYYGYGYGYESSDPKSRRRGESSPEAAKPTSVSDG